MYVAVKGGERAIENAHALLADARRGDRSVPEISLEQIAEQLALAVDRVMSEGSLYDRELAALAIKQARGDLIEAIFLLRAFRTTLSALRRVRAARYREHGRSAGASRRSSRICPAARCSVRPSITPTACSIKVLPMMPMSRSRATAAHDGTSMRPVTDLLADDDLIERTPANGDADAVGDLTREPL